MQMPAELVSIPMLSNGNQYGVGFFQAQYGIDSTLLLLTSALLFSFHAHSGPFGRKEWEPGGIGSKDPEPGG